MTMGDYLEKLLPVTDTNSYSFDGVYKKNPRLIKTKEINKLALSCVQRNQQLLNIYKKDYFIPAYNEYKKIDSSIGY